MQPLYLLANNGEIRMCCPNPECGDSKYHLYVNPVKKVAHCFHCGLKWSPKEGTFRKFEEMYNFKLPTMADLDNLPVVSEETQEVDVRFPDGFRSLVENWDIQDAAPFRTYFEDRGFSYAEALDYRIGYCTFGKFQWRVVIPCFEKGKLVYYMGRAIANAPNTVRYLYPSSEELGIGRSSVIFNSDAGNIHSSIIVCEGAFSAMAAGRNAVALLSKTATAYQLRKIANYTAKEITVLLDGNAWEDAVHLADALYKRSVGKDIYIGALQYGEDPASISVDRRAVILKSAIQFNPADMVSLLMEGEDNQLEANDTKPRWKEKI